MASHGTDQLIVQRLLTCRTLSDSRKALIGSGLIVMVQFALFLAVGLLLWVYYAGASLDALGLTRGDEVFPKFIIEGLPQGVSGLILAGILAAAMSTLSSSLNSLASSTMMDLAERFFPATTDERRGLRQARGWTLFWGVVFMGFATIFENQDNPVVELGLAIASYTYGGLLGAFLLGLANQTVRERGAIFAFLITIATTTLVIFSLWYSPDAGWVWNVNPSAEVIAAQRLQAIGWPWYTAMGAVLMLVLGSLIAALQRVWPHFLTRRG